ncbi:RagB/SusD family nutrient uptake outer membrane protein [Cellulophaga sp. 20_2_10]|uniref:RagB/SusD family nutrient uptake outer membrane protein n=1 Tax=Cellulophaga sp. 20_2_10 TaxID=2942476 RepID=UPI00201ABC2D|nr:RagB/SusD family nutrient uptake outer membrane protein [Cellulophaga sp. 20_2_10]MCL5246137.1 RagB/SusD family nutrient uptake outer membrane protein [Cellulophaga sp. 20_2_10]
MKTYKHILLLALLCSGVSCNDFLEENPSKTTSVVPETLEHLEQLLNDYNSFGSEGASELIYGTDDFAIQTDLYEGISTVYSLETVQHGTWDIDYLPTTGRPYWPEEWEKIFTANLIIQNLSSVSGEDSQKQMVKAEAHFIRAYSYFQMANIYCLPYTNGNKAELGLPLKQTTSFEENIERATLEDTYAYIEADLQKALELNRDLEVVNGQNRTWRASTVAVLGFAARYYLSLNDYAMAQSYAEDALDLHSYLRDYNTEMSFSTRPNPVTIFNPDAETVNIEYPYTHDLQSIPTDKLEWGESYYYRFLSNGAWNYFPSTELLNSYNQDYDLRYKYHIVEDYTYDRGAVDPAYSYPGYIFFFKSDILSGPSVPEMLLIKAECQVRQGSWADGIQTANILRGYRIDASAPANIRDLSATSEADALTKVLEERRREMPFVHRWYDIRRYNNNEVTTDDVIMSRTFYPYTGGSILGAESPINYTLDKNSRRFARPIPETDIIASGGTLKQNEY